MAGYSSTPLASKLGLKAGMVVCILHAPDTFVPNLGPIVSDLTVHTTLRTTYNYIHVFVKDKNTLEKQLPGLIKSLAPKGMIWISWPKKASKVTTDITEQTLRDVGLPLGIVDIKVCAIDDIWSGLKFVRRAS